jgi:hypothetical protein
MTTEAQPTEYRERRTKVVYRNGSTNAVYGLGLIGAWVYYISSATTLVEGLIGFLKGIVWPAFMVYDLLKYLQ